MLSNSAAPRFLDNLFACDEIPIRSVVVGGYPPFCVSDTDLANITTTLKKGSFLIIHLVHLKPFQWVKTGRKNIVEFIWAEIVTFLYYTLLNPEVIKGWQLDQQCA